MLILLIFIQMVLGNNGLCPDCGVFGRSISGKDSLHISFVAISHRKRNFWRIASNYRTARVCVDGQYLRRFDLSDDCCSQLHLLSEQSICRKRTMSRFGMNSKIDANTVCPNIPKLKDILNLILILKVRLSQAIMSLPAKSTNLRE